MSSKQLAQALPSRNSTVPYVIGKDYQYLSSKMFKHVAEYPGTVIYKNPDIMLVLFKPEHKDEFIETFKIPEFIATADKFAMELHYCIEVGDFEAGDLLFEYNSFRNGIYAAGYNINTAYMNFFGMTFEDSIVLSESAAKKMISHKMDKILIPIYSHTLIKPTTYPNSKYGFIPEIGQKINGKIIYSQYISKDNQNKENHLATLTLDNLIELLNDDYQYNIKHKFTKLENAVIRDIKIHKFKNSKTLLDSRLRNGLIALYDDYCLRCSKIFKDAVNIVGMDYATKNILYSHYLMNSHKQNLNISIQDLLYVIELEFVKEYDIKVGDKLANNFANKGVVSCIIPDELMPVIESTGDRIDAVVGSLSVYSRMVFSQIIVIVMSKVLRFIEREILQDPSTIQYYIRKLIKLNNVIGDDEYDQRLKQLITDIDTNPNMINEFIHSVESDGLYFEMANFTNFNFEELLDIIKQEFNIDSNETIVYPKKLYNYMANLTGNNEAIIPDEDVYQQNIFCGPNYMLRLKQIAENKNTARDLGNYSASTKQPIKDITGGSNTHANKIGNMEMDALIAHGLVDYVIPELRTVKSDCIDMKSDLITQIIKTGEYHMKESSLNSSYTKSVIDSLMMFLSKDYE